MSTLGRVLAVQSDTALCDSKGDHELTLITDGTRAYAHGHATDLTVVCREAGNRYTATCGQPGPGWRGEEGDPCEGTVEWDLSADYTWTSDPKAIDYLTRFGEPVEYGDSMGTTP